MMSRIAKLGDPLIVEVALLRDDHHHEVVACMKELFDLVPSAAAPRRVPGRNVRVFEGVIRESLVGMLRHQVCDALAQALEVCTAVHVEMLDVSFWFAPESTAPDV